MDYQKFTQKSLSAIQNAQNVASEYGNSEINQEHLLYSLLTQEEGLISEVLKGQGVNVDEFSTGVRTQIEKFPRVSGGNQAYMSNDLNKAFQEAEKQAKSMNDDFISVEHLMLGIILKASSSISGMLSKYKISNSL